MLKTTDTIVSLYVYGVAIVLVIYMVATFLHGSYTFLTGLPEMVKIINGGFDSDIAHQREEIETGILHFIAFTIVLVKAYKILIAYAKHQHVSIKYIVEISIIAAAVEIFFNSHAYHIDVLALFAAFGVANLALYLVYYKVFQDMD